MICVCSLVGTASCALCPNNPNAPRQYRNFITWTNSAERMCRNISGVPLKFKCSECGDILSKPNIDEFNYCPNCGAKVIA